MLDRRHPSPTRETAMRRVAGALLLTSGLLSALIYVIALLDPVGTKLADDGDPFGTPPPASESITGLLVCVALAAVGLWLLRGKKRPPGEVMRVLAPVAVAVSALAVTACAAASRPSTPPTPAVLLARAIERAGREEALTAARALAWSGDAVVHAGRRTVRISGEWAVQPPDTAVIATHDVTRGPASARRDADVGRAGLAGPGRLPRRATAPRRASWTRSAAPGCTPPAARTSTSRRTWRRRAGSASGTGAR
jgi:hypothetical protein